MYSSEFFPPVEEDLRPLDKKSLWAAIAGVQKLHDEVVRAHADQSFPQRHAIQVSRPLWYLAQAMEPLANANALEAQEVKRIVEALRALMALEDVNLRRSEEPLLMIKRILEGVAYRLNGLQEDLHHEIAALVENIDHLIETGRTRRKVSRIVAPKPLPPPDPIEAMALRLATDHIFQGSSTGALN